MLSSLTELVVVGDSLYDPWTCCLLCDALMKRVEQGVPLEMLDLRMCFLRSFAEFWLLSEVVVDVLGLETSEAKISMWDAVGRGLFVTDENPEEDDG